MFVYILGPGLSSISPDKMRSKTRKKTKEKVRLPPPPSPNPPNHSDSTHNVVLELV